MFEKVDISVKEHMDYVVRELDKQCADFTVDEEKQEVKVRGTITIKDPTILVEEVPATSVLFEGLYDKE